MVDTQANDVLVSFRGVQKSYDGENLIVKDLNLDIRKGEFLTLLGPSGSGKTTSLMMLAGFETPTAGEILLAGKAINNVPPHKRDIGMVFQNYALFPHMTVAENLAFPLTVRGMNKTDITERVKRALSMVQLDNFRNRYPAQLSGGQQQRVALARAMAPRPRLLLLDEPFSNLDAELRERLAHELRAILKAAGQTVLFVTHDQFEAFAIGDRIGVMNEGHLHQWDDAYTLYHRPETRFVADFIGHGVFVPAHIVQDASGTHVDTPLGRLRDTDECPLPSAYPGGYCDLLLRADDIVHDDGSGVKAQILRKAFRGSEFLYTLRLASGETVLAHVPSHHNHRVGEWIGIQPDVDHVVVFQPDPQRVPPA